MSKNSIKGKIIILICSIAWGFAFVMQRKASEILSTFSINALRCLIGAIFLLPFVLINDKKKSKKLFGNDKVERKYILVTSILCGVFVFIGMSFQQFGISIYPSDVASSGRSGFITALYVVIVPILSLFLKKKLKLNSIFSVILSCVGLYLLCFSNGINGIYFGDLLVLFSAFGYALQIMVIDSSSGKISGIKLAFFQFIICSILSFICMLIFEKVSFNKIIDAIIPLLYLGIISTGLGYTLQIVGQQYSNNPTIDSLIMSLESAFALIGGAIFMHEKLLINEIIGCIIMFLAIIIAQLPSIKFKKKMNN